MIRPSRSEGACIVNDRQDQSVRVKRCKAEVDEECPKRVLAALQAVGNPQDDLKNRVVHVAGTSGKAAICMMVYEALRESDCCVGLLCPSQGSEPFDAVRLGRGSEELAISPELWEHLRDELDQSIRNGPLIELTAYEVLVVTALLFFARTQVDICIIEVGLGGRFDATNVFSKIAVCAVTNVGLAHAELLGDQIENIAWHMCGIFQARRAVMVAVSRMSDSVKTVVDRCAQEARVSKVKYVNPAEKTAPDCEGGEEFIRIAGLATRIDLAANTCGLDLSNVALAVSLLLELRDQGLALRSKATKLDTQDLNDERIAMCIARVFQPSRIQWSIAPGGRTAVLAEAYNVDSAKSLAQYIDGTVRIQGQCVAWICGMSAGKDTLSVLKVLLTSERDSFVAVPFSVKSGWLWIRPMESRELVRLARQTRPMLEHCSARSSLEEAFEAVRSHCSSDAVPVVCGSRHLLSDFTRLKEESLFDAE